MPPQKKTWVFSAKQFQDAYGIHRQYDLPWIEAMRTGLELSGNTISGLELARKMIQTFAEGPIVTSEPLQIRLAAKSAKDPELFGWGIELRRRDTKSGELHRFWIIYGPNPRGSSFLCKVAYSVTPSSCRFSNSEIIENV